MKVGFGRKTESSSPRHEEFFELAAVEVIERYRSIKSIDQIGFIDELDR